MVYKQEGVQTQGLAHWRIFIALFQGIMLLFCGFLAGWYWQEANAEDQIRIELVQNIPDQKEQKSSAKIEGVEEMAETEGECLYIASKNSDKYHNPESGPAKRIKPENKLCFSSAQEAEDEGYEAGTL